MVFAVPTITSGEVFVSPRQLGENIRPQDLSYRSRYSHPHTEYKDAQVESLEERQFGYLG